MTAHSGDSFSGDMIFPPFVPRAAPPATAPASHPEVAHEAPVEAAAKPDPWAADAPAQSAAPAVTETADEPAEELPWLEVPHAAAEEAAAFATGESAADEAVPDWMAWDPGSPAAAVTETPELPPSGDVDASAAAREVGEEAPMAGLVSFDRDATADVAPVDGLAPVGDFDIPAGDDAGEPAAAYETPVWAQPTEEWAAPPAEGPDPLLASAVPAMPVEIAAEPIDGADDYAGADPAADEPVASSLDAELTALLDAPAHPPVETAAPADVAADDGSRADVAPPLPAAHGDDRLAAMLGEVAGRLESIARSLRDRTPAEVLAGPRHGAADPLELLVTGFVLGYLQRGGDR